MPREIFRITSAGSVDDGKSTILARLLLDSGSVFEDQLGGIDPSKVDAKTIADLLDGLESERDQGITIDVAHRFFDSDSRRYHITDSPGHEQYTRNMATAASQANALLLVIDARTGTKPQTRTHLAIAHKLGIRDIVVAVNKMDLVAHRERVFREREAEIVELVSQFPGITFTVVPVVGLTGANVVKPGRELSWWLGTTILAALDNINLKGSDHQGTVISVQSVQRIPGGGRRYLGSLLAGTIRAEEPLSHGGTQDEVFPSDLIVSGSAALQAMAPAEISFFIKQEIDLDRGAVLTNSNSVEFTDQFRADLVWLAPQPAVVGRTYELRLGYASRRVSISRLWQVDEESDKRGGEIRQLQVNKFAVANLEATGSLFLSSFEKLPQLGRFILIDPATANTVGAGVVLHSLHRAGSVTPFEFETSRTDREKLTGVRGQVFWLTGLSGSGKSSLANEFAKELTLRGLPHTVLDGDSLRKGINRDLGFSEPERVENIRRTAEVAKLIADAGLIVVVSLISPFLADRERARGIIGEERFIEVFVDTPIEVCEARDPKGLYMKARQGLIPNFTGVSSRYENPSDPDILVDGQAPLAESLSSLLKALTKSPLQ